MGSAVPEATLEESYLDKSEHVTGTTQHWLDTECYSLGGWGGRWFTVQCVLAVEYSILPEFCEC